MQRRSLLAISMLACARLVGAQDYPTKPITIVVPAVAGGATDIIARTLAEELGRQMKQTVIVDNKPGGGGIVGVQAVARAPADGYTLLLTNSGPVLTLPLLSSRVPYDVRRDLSFVSQICTGLPVLAVHASVPARNMQEFITWAQTHKGKLAYGSYGIGTFGHLVSAYLSQSRQLDMVHIAYKGEGALIQDLAGGQIPWTIATAGALEPHVQSGRVRILAVLGDQRIATLPDVPTMREAGMPDPEFKPVGWIAMMMPAHTPAPLLARLEHEVRTAVGATAMKARFQAFGLSAMGTRSAEFRADYDKALPVAERLVKVSGARLD